MHIFTGISSLICQLLLCDDQFSKDELELIDASDVVMLEKKGWCL